MELERKITTKFKKDFKKIRYNFKIVEEFEYVVKKLAKQEKLEESYLDHDLKGEYKGYRECHIRPDLLLVYKIKENDLILLLLRLGSHSEIF